MHFISFIFPIQRFGIYPRKLSGLIGIIMAPLLHSDLAHLISNTLGLLTFGIIFILQKDRKSFFIISSIYLLQGSMLWLFGRSAIHIGSSGIIFGLFGYLLFIGYFKRKIKYILISLFTLISYGGMIFGVLPTNHYISFEGHLFGFIIGGFVAKLATKFK